MITRTILVKSAPKAAALRRPPPQGGGETGGAARRLFLMSSSFLIGIKPAAKSLARYNQPTRLKRQYIKPQVVAIKPSASG